MTDLQRTAQTVAAAGRGPDTMIMHVTPDEVRDISRMGLAAGIGPVGINPETGYPEAGFFGDLFKGLASALPGLLGTAFLGPMGGALAQGLFTGATKGDFKKGLLAGLGAYMGGKALTGAVGAVGASKEAAAQAAAQTAGTTGPGGVVMPGIYSLVSAAPPAPTGVEFLKAIPGAITSPSALEAGVSDAFSGRSGLMLPAMMKEVDSAIQADSGGTGSTYDQRVEEEQRKYRSRYGQNPYRFYGGNVQRYATGGAVPPATSQIEPYDVAYTPIQGYDGGSTYTSQQATPYGYTNPDEDFGDKIVDAGRKAINTETGQRPPYESPMYNMFQGIQSWAPPQGFAPGFHGEFQYLSQNRPQNPMGYGGTSWGQNPFTFNPYAGMGGGGYQVPPGGFDTSTVGGQGGPTTPPVSDGGRGGFGGGQGGFGQPNPYMGNFGAPPFSMGMPFGPTPSFGGFGYQPSPFGGGGFGGFGWSGGLNPYARRSPWGFAGGGDVPHPTGGMGDGIAAAIVAPDGSSEPAMLSPGEYVIPADVVSMLGDGDTDAGSNQLDQMLGRVRMQKTGTPNQLPPADLNLLPG